MITARAVIADYFSYNGDADRDPSADADRLIANVEANGYALVRRDALMVLLSPRGKTSTQVLDALTVVRAAIKMPLAT